MGICGIKGRVWWDIVGNGKSGKVVGVEGGARMNDFNELLVLLVDFAFGDFLCRRRSVVRSFVR